MFPETSSRFQDVAKGKRETRVAFAGLELNPDELANRSLVVSSAFTPALCAGA
jgi:hypothetical protein